jgi:hypothetical protein
MLKRKFLFSVLAKVISLLPDFCAPTMQEWELTHWKEQPRKCVLFLKILSREMLIPEIFIRVFAPQWMRNIGVKLLFSNTKNEESRKYIVGTCCDYTTDRTFCKLIPHFWCDRSLAFFISVYLLVWYESKDFWLEIGKLQN